MFKKMMLAGLMSATVLSGIAPAYAQDRAARSERAKRGGGDAAVSRGNRMTQPRNDGARAQRPLLCALLLVPALEGEDVQRGVLRHARAEAAGEARGGVFAPC